jgi:hypothetical protein
MSIYVITDSAYAFIILTAKDLLQLHSPLPLRSGSLVVFLPDTSARVTAMLRSAQIEPSILVSARVPAYPRRASSYDFSYFRGCLDLLPTSPLRRMSHRADRRLPCASERLRKNPLRMRETKISGVPLGGSSDRDGISSFVKSRRFRATSWVLPIPTAPQILRGRFDWSEVRRANSRGVVVQDAT